MFLINEFVSIGPWDFWKLYDSFSFAYMGGAGTTSIAVPGDIPPIHLCPGGSSQVCPPSISMFPKWPPARAAWARVSRKKHTKHLANIVVERGIPLQHRRGGGVSFFYRRRCRGGA